MTKNDKVYSYHTFYFPFVWSDGGNVEFDDYTGMLKLKKWDDISINGFDDIENKEKGMTPAQTYQMLQYFTEAARASMFGWGENFVKYYAYRQKDVHEKAVYHIKAGEYTYDLALNGIKLRVFNTGVAVLSFETENRQYRSINDVKRINEFGRRIFAPFFVDGYCFECADELGIIGIQYNGENISKIATTRPKSENDCIPNFIRELLPFRNIKPAIDDRMFVACCVSDEDYAKQIKNYKTSPEVSKSLYEFIYIDRPDNCSCMSDAMRDKLLDESVYDRWIDYGTLYGITHHAMVCIHDGSFEPNNFSFIAIYTQMVVMVLAQRAAIIVFDEMSSSLVRKINISKITEFQKKYIAFRNQHNNIEITCQEQGVEIYEMLQKAMYVKENNDKLEKDANILYETASALSDRGLNIWGLVFAVAFGVVSIADLILSILSFCKQC